MAIWIRRAFLTAAITAVMTYDSSTDAQAPAPARVAELAGCMPEGTFSPTPTIDDREFWARVHATAAYAAVTAGAERLLDRPVQPLPDDLYLEYSKTGNRTRYEKVFFAKLRDFRTLLIAECVENRGRFVGSIQDLIGSFAADKTWVLPAHDGRLGNFEGRQITIDLFASEVACDVATADHVLGDRLAAETRGLVRREATRRIFEPYRGMLTTGTPGPGWLNATHNWNAVCLANVTGAALALHRQPAEKAFYVAAAEHSVTNFLGGFTADGYCSEGVAYWNYGYGCFVRLGHMLHGATGGNLDLFALPAARSAGTFARRIEITPGVYPAFADCSIGATPEPEIMAYVSRRYDLDPTAWEQEGPVTVRWLDELGVFSFALGPPAAKRPAAVPGPRDWFDHAGVMICRGGTTAAGLPVAVALKGGHNSEHHNHNDVGSYVMCIGRSPTLADPGAEVYTRRTFSKDRYVSDVLNSFGHPVPRVAGQLQQTGRSAEAKVLNMELTDERDTLEFDIASAYPVESLQSLTRRFEFDRAAASLTVTDKAVFTAPEAFGTAVMTFDSWKRLAVDRLQVGEGDAAVDVRIDSGGLPVTIDATTINEDVRAGKRPTRIGIDLAGTAAEAVIRLTIRPCR